MLTGGSGRNAPEDEREKREKNKYERGKRKQRQRDELLDSLYTHPRARTLWLFGSSPRLCVCLPSTDALLQAICVTIRLTAVCSLQHGSFHRTALMVHDTTRPVAALGDTSGLRCTGLVKESK